MLDEHLDLDEVLRVIRTGLDEDLRYGPDVTTTATVSADAVAKATHDFDEDALTVVQEPQLGTAHAVAQAAPLLSDARGEAMVLYGDTPFIRPETLQAMLASSRVPRALRVATQLPISGWVCTSTQSWLPLAAEATMRIACLGHTACTSATPTASALRMIADRLCGLLTSSITTVRSG